MTEFLRIFFAISIGIAFACCEASSLWWVLPLIIVLLILKLNVAWSLIAAGALITPLLWRRFREKQRKLQLIRQMPELIETLSNCLRAGMTIEAGIKESLHNLQGPVRVMIETVSHQITLGLGLEEALESQAKKWPDVPIIKQLSSAVILSRKNGMDTSQLFDTLAEEARSDLTIQERLMSLSAQARLQAIVIGLLPLALLIILSMMEPKRIEVFFHDPRGQILMGAMIVLELIGMIWIKRLIRI